ncbi:MAG: hemerythrin family protein [Magnetococcales bacterium]|nr:hemerythrin family protein [Magnetococcales bacterium]
MLWDSNFALGVERIDQQHRAIIERIHRLDVALNSSVTSVTLPRMHEAHDFLVGYVTEHFREEEALMVEGNYPDLEQHIAQHHAFEATLHKFRTDLDKSGLMSLAASQLVSYLSNWFISHIQIEDPKYLPYIKKQS